MYHSCPINLNEDRFSVPHAQVRLISDVLDEPINDASLLSKAGRVAHELHHLPMTPLTKEEQDQIKFLSTGPESYCVISAVIVLRRIWPFPIQKPKNQLPSQHISNWNIREYVSSLMEHTLRLSESQLIFMIGYIHNCMHDGPKTDLPLL